MFRGSKQLKTVIQNEHQRQEASTAATTLDPAGQGIIQAEQYKVNLNQPTGNNVIMDTAVETIDNDDDFFHVSCHIEAPLKEKIERGEFVDLERLLPRERANFRNSEDKKLELVSRDGQAFFAPAQDKKIYGLRRWEQAFRIYAAIYSKAQPHRASEIWQYLHVINIAASAYSWENVAFYDYTFRQLMSANPRRSWSKTYVQGWNLAMTEPLAKGNSNNNSTMSKPNHSTGAQRKDWRDYCCWKFNKNKCNNPTCEWDHHCTYCGGWNHNFLSCRKRQKREGHKHKFRSRSRSPRSSPEKASQEVMFRTTKQVINLTVFCSCFNCHS